MTGESMNVEEEVRTPAWLRRLRVTRVALVDQGANEHSQITFHKREENDMTTTASSQTVIFEDIKKRAVREFPTLTEPQAIDRYVTEIPEGQALARQHSKAVVDYQPEEVVTNACWRRPGRGDRKATRRRYEGIRTHPQRRTRGCLRHRAGDRRGDVLAPGIRRPRAGLKH